jgi:hypothetical protein
MRTSIPAASRAGAGGACLYPIIDRPDWEDPGHWHNSGLWDLVKRHDGTLERVINEEYARAFDEMRHRVASECGALSDRPAEPQAGSTRIPSSHPADQRGPSSAPLLLGATRTTSEGRTNA